MIVEGKFTSICDSVLFPQVREKFDSECSKAEDYFREALEYLADLLCQSVRSDTNKCKAILDSGKTIDQAYKHMAETATKRVKQRSDATMSDREAIRISLEFFGAVDRGTEVKKTVPQLEKKEEGVKSLFDMI